MEQQAMALLWAIGALFAMVLVGWAAVRFSLTKQFHAAAPLLLAAGMILVAVGAVRPLIRLAATPKQTEMSNMVGELKTFSDGHYNLEGKDPIEASDAQNLVKNLAEVGTTMAKGVWNGLSSAHLPLLVTVISIIVALFVYMGDKSVMTLMFRLIGLALIWTYIVGPDAKFPRWMIRLADEVTQKAITSTAFSFAERSVKDRNAWDQIEVYMAAQSARMPEGVKPLAKVYIDAATKSKNGAAVAEAGFISRKARDAVGWQHYRYRPVKDVPDVDVPVRLVSVSQDGQQPDASSTNANAHIVFGCYRGKPPVQRMPAPVVSWLEESGDFGKASIFYADDKSDTAFASWYAKFFTNVDGVPLLPVDLNNAEVTKLLWNTEFRSMIAPIGAVGMIPLASIADESWLKEKLKMAANQAKERIAADLEARFNREVEVERLNEPGDENKKKKQAKQNSYDKYKSQLLGVIAAPSVVAMPPMASAVADGIQRAAWSPNEQGLAYRSGYECAAILENRRAEDPACWGCLLKEISAGSDSYGFRSGQATGTDYLSNGSQVALWVRDVVGKKSGELQFDDAYFAAGASVLREVNGSTAADVPEIGTAGKIVGAIFGFFRTIVEFGAFIYIKVVNAFLIPIAMSWAPMVIGVAMMFLIGLYPIVSLIALWPGRWGIALDWAKASFWVMSWVYMAYLGAMLIDFNGLWAETGQKTSAQQMHFVYLINTLGTFVIFSAPIITKIIIDWSANGIAGIASAASNKTIAVAGQITGSAMTLAMIVATVLTAGAAAAVGGGAAAAGAGAGAAGKAGAGAGASGAGAAGAAGAKAAGGRAVGGLGQRLGGLVQTANSQLQAGKGLKEVAEGILKNAIPKPSMGGSGAKDFAQGALTSLRDQAISGASNAVGDLAPNSKVPAGDRMAQAAVAAWGGNSLAATSQWRGRGSEQSNRDMSEGGRGGGGGGGGGGGSPDKGGQAPGSRADQAAAKAAQAHQQGDRAGTAAGLAEARAGMPSANDRQLEQVEGSAQEIGRNAEAAAVNAESAGQHGIASEQRAVAAQAYGTAAAAQHRRANRSTSPGAARALSSQAAQNEARAQDNADRSAAAGEQATAGGGSASAAVSIAVSVAISQTHANSLGNAIAVTGLRTDSPSYGEAMLRRVYEPREGDTGETRATKSANLDNAIGLVRFGDRSWDQAVTEVGGVSPSQIATAARDTDAQLTIEALQRRANVGGKDIPDAERQVLQRQFEQMRRRPMSDDMRATLASEEGSVLHDLGMLEGSHHIGGSESAMSAAIARPERVAGVAHHVASVLGVKDRTPDPAVSAWAVSTLGDRTSRVIGAHEGKEGVLEDAALMLTYALDAQIKQSSGERPDGSMRQVTSIGQRLSAALQEAPRSDDEASQQAIAVSLAKRTSEIANQDVLIAADRLGSMDGAAAASRMMYQPINTGPSVLDRADAMKSDYDQWITDKDKLQGAERSRWLSVADADSGRLSGQLEEVANLIGDDPVQQAVLISKQRVTKAFRANAVSDLGESARASTISGEITTLGDRFEDHYTKLSPDQRAVVDQSTNGDGEYVTRVQSALSHRA